MMMPTTRTKPWTAARAVSLAAACWMACALAGCASEHHEDHRGGDSAAGEDRARMIGTKERYRADLDAVAIAAREALREAGLTITDEGTAGPTRHLRASAPVDGPVQWKNVQVWCSTVRAGVTMVHVVADRTRPRADAEQTALTNDIFARLGQRLNGPMRKDER